MRWLGRALPAGHSWQSRLTPAFRNVLWVAVKLRTSQIRVITSAVEGHSSALIERLEFAFRRANINLPRAVDAPRGVVAELFPVGDPAGKPAQSEHDGEHVRRDAHGP